MPQIALTAHSQILVLAHTFAVIQHHQTQVMLISIEIFPVIIEKNVYFTGINIQLIVFTLIDEFIDR